MEQGRWLLWFCRVLGFLMACGQTLGRTERQQGGKRTQWDRDGNHLLERCLSREQRGCCGGESAFPVLHVSAAAQLVPFPRSVWQSGSAVCYLLKNLLKSRGRAIAGNSSIADNSDWPFCTHLSDTNSKSWVNQISQALSFLLTKL